MWNEIEGNGQGMKMKGMDRKGKEGKGSVWRGSEVVGRGREEEWGSKAEMRKRRRNRKWKRK